MNYQNLLFLLDHGIPCVVKDKDGDYQYFSCSKDIYGSYRRSGWCKTIEGAKQYIGNCYGYSIENLIKSCSSWTLVEQCYDLPEPLPVGTKVRVRNNAEEIMKKCGWNFIDEKKGYCGFKYEVEKSDCIVVKITGQWFPCQAVEVVFEEECRYEGELEWIEQGKKFGYKEVNKGLIKE